jgi:hypothetical protein
MMVCNWEITKYVNLINVLIYFNIINKDFRIGQDVVLELASFKSKWVPLFYTSMDGGIHLHAYKECDLHRFRRICAGYGCGIYWPIYGLAADREIGSGGLLWLKVVNLIISALFGAGGPMLWQYPFFFFSLPSC